MLKSLSSLLTHNAGSLPATPPVVPLRRNVLPLDQLKVGNAVMFSESCPIPQLRARKCAIRGVRTYRFGNDSVTSYQLNVEGTEQYSLAIAEDTDGHYLALSRQLDEAEQDEWFGRDALSFFTEPSTARTIRCKADQGVEAAWAGDRYAKIVDWVAGVLVGVSKAEGAFRYNLLVTENGQKALEIEHYEASGRNTVYVTVYRPIEDILTIAEAIPYIPAPAKPAPMPEAPKPQRHAPRPDFRRITDDVPPIHVAPVIEPVLAAMPVKTETEQPPLPSFLTSAREEPAYLSLDEVIPPETERVRCSARAAKALLDVSLERGIRVRDVLRELLGLESALSDEVIFELPLSERDYRALAQRYRLRPDHTDEIRRRLQEELRKKLLS